MTHLTTSRPERAPLARLRFELIVMHTPHSGPEGAVQAKQSVCPLRQVVTGGGVGTVRAVFGATPTEPVLAAIASIEAGVRASGRYENTLPVVLGEIYQTAEPGDVGVLAELICYGGVDRDGPNLGWAVLEAVWDPAGEIAGSALGEEVAVVEKISRQVVSHPRWVQLFDDAAGSMLERRGDGRRAWGWRDLSWLRAAASLSSDPEVLHAVVAWPGTLDQAMRGTAFRRWAESAQECEVVEVLGATHWMRYDPESLEAVLGRLDAVTRAVVEGRAGLGEHPR